MSSSAADGPQPNNYESVYSRQVELKQLIDRLDSLPPEPSDASQADPTVEEERHRLQSRIGDLYREIRKMKAQKASGSGNGLANLQKAPGKSHVARYPSIIRESMGMSTPSTFIDDLQAGFGEFVATTLFVFIGVGAATSVTHGQRVVFPNNSDVVTISLAFGFAIFILVSAYNAVSGGHINPAVTWAMILTRNITIRRGCLYIVCQLVGSILGSALLKGAFRDLFSDGVGVNSRGTMTVGEAILLEAVLTCILVLVIFNVSIKHGPSEHIAPLAIGFAVCCAHFVAVPMTGCSINPARSFGPAVIQGEWEDQWIFWVAPLLGASFAPLLVYFHYGTVHTMSIDLTAGVSTPGDYHFTLGGMDNFARQPEMELI